ncbi:MAG: hypothetical protein JWP78_577 [Mucilaginibacter sp.]|nr:hypothetical protein [Mucilaginibacter sp.]
MPIYHYSPLFLLLVTGMVLSVKTEKLTLSGAITGGMIAVLIFIGAGYAGLSMLGAFFIFGTVATVWKKKEKRLVELKEDQSVKRSAGQVFANGGIAALTGALIYFIPAKTELLRLMMAASLASAMADTLSSELGMIYGRRFYNIISWKRDERGLNGVVSLEGTLIGIAGSAIIAVIYALGFGWDNAVLFILIAGTAGNLADSVLGALLERGHYLNNDMVNFLNTFIAVLTAALCMAFL